MTDGSIAHQDLLNRVALKLMETSSSTDHLMLTKWRVLSTCQYLLGTQEADLEATCKTALEVFATLGAGDECDKALEASGASIKLREGGTQTALPSISKDKRLAVTEQLDALTDRGVAIIEEALGVLGAVRSRMTASATGGMLPGIQHRFGVVASILQDASRPANERVRAAAAVLYVNEVRDVIPDTLGPLGLLDDDYALRFVLNELDQDQTESHLHWSEKLSSLWDDLPFLRGVNLQSTEGPIPVTWLDRVNSFVSYDHVIRLDRSPLLLLQPSVACSPLHAIVSLVGLLVLEAVTSSQTSAQALRLGQTYEIAGAFVRFEGFAGPPMSGWLRLRVRNGIVYQPPGLSDHMIAVDSRRLSSDREFASRPRVMNADPIQRFFDWDAVIGPGAITSRLVIVASHARALELLDGVHSNGVRLLDHGLVRFVGSAPDAVDTHGTLILVVPSLGTARLLCQMGLRVQAVLVDGYERLHRGRHELPFLVNAAGAPPIIGWSATGYYPSASPPWLPPHKLLEVSSDDLAGILALDEVGTDLPRMSLWEAATGLDVTARPTRATDVEDTIADAIDLYVTSVRTSDTLPEYWRYHLLSVARTLRLLVMATPAEWSEIRRVASAWSSSIENNWATLRPSAIAALSIIRTQEKRILTLIAGVPESTNSRAKGLQAFLTEAAANERWYLLCDRPEQMKVVASLIRAEGIAGVEPVLLKDLAVCRNCVVAGWVTSEFARRLWAHTPKSVVALADDRDRQRWERAAEARLRPIGRSLLEAVGGFRASAPSGVPAGPSEGHVAHQVGTDASVEWSSGERTPCVFLWLVGETEAKVLARDSLVVVEEDEAVSERPAARLLPDDRVILGLGSSRWSPADEFTEAVIDAVRSSQPEVVKAAKAWRAALRRLRDTKQLTTTELRALLLSVHIERGPQTLDGWLAVERAAPIAPRGAGSELTALWPLIGEYAEHPLSEIMSACSRLRALRVASGRALLQLWKGKPVDLGVDSKSLAALVSRLREEVHVYEIETVILGDVPISMLGWWISSPLVTQFESESGHTPSVSEDDAVEDVERHD